MKFSLAFRQPIPYHNGMKSIDRLFLMVIVLAALYIAFATCRYHYFVITPDGWPAMPYRIDRFTGAVSIFSWQNRWIRQTPDKKQPDKPVVNPEDPLGLSVISLFTCMSNE